MKTKRFTTRIAFALLLTAMMGCIPFNAAAVDRVLAKATVINAGGQNITLSEGQFVSILDESNGMATIKVALPGGSMTIGKIPIANLRPVVPQAVTPAIKQKAETTSPAGVSATQPASAAVPRGSGTDWPQWRGPDRNGISTETGWKATWAAEGPKVVWKANFGPGCATFSVVGDQLFTMGNDKDTGFVYCINAKNGSIVWKHSFPSALQPNRFEGGQDSTPAVDGNFVYALGRQGQFFCLNKATGAVVWSKDFVTDFGAKVATWGYSGSPLVLGKMVIIDVGGTGASAVAFDKANGDVIWKAGNDAQAYSSPYAFNDGGKQLLAFFNAFGLVVREAADGKEVMRFPWKTQSDINVATPIVSDGKVFIASGYNHGGALVPMNSATPKSVWESKNMKNHMNSCVLWKGNLYGFDDAVLTCMDFATGSVKWQEKTPGKGALMLADGKLIIQAEDGALIIAEASPEAYKELAKTQAVPKRSWVNPVLACGKIYCRNNNGESVCLDVSGGGAVAMPGQSPNISRTVPQPAVPQPTVALNAVGGKVPPEVETAMKMPEGPDQIKALVAAGQEWAKKEPAAAVAWAFQLPPALSAKVCSPVALVNPPVSADWFIQQNKKGENNLHGLLLGWGMADPTASEAWCMKAPKNVRYLAFFSVADGLARKDRTSGPAWVEKLKAEAEEDRFAAIHGVAMMWGRGDVDAAAVWMKQLKPDEMKFAAKVVASGWHLTKLKSRGATKAEAVKPWLDQFPLSDKEKEEILTSPAPPSFGPLQK